MIERECPACGSTDIKDEKVITILKEPFGGQDVVDKHEIVCSMCGSRGDFFNENDDVINEAVKKLKQKSIENIIDDFANKKISMSAIERALEIPQRTLTKWKNGNAAPSSTGLSLMRFIRLFPWLLDVAENKYDYSEAQKIHIKAAVQKLLSVVAFDKGSFANAGIVATSQSVFIYMQYSKKGIEAQGHQHISGISNQQPHITSTLIT